VTRVARTEPPALDCPSSQPAIRGARIIGVMSESEGQSRVAYLEQAVPLSPELLERTAPLDPTRVLRIAAPCETSACPHFEADRCSLAEKVANLLPVAVDELAPCPIRKTCRWFAQEGKAICTRCAGVTTAVDRPPEYMQFVVDPRTRLRHLPVLR
jgi:hypothetical protein